MRREWLLRLRPDPHQPVDPVLPATVLAPAQANLGQDPVAWAVQRAETIAAEILQHVPEHGGGPTPASTLRRSTESAFLTALRLLLSDSAMPIAALTDETREGCQEFARRGIPLELVLRGVRLGHARLAHDLAAAIEEHLPADQRMAELLRINDLLFTYADAHASMMAEEYIAERGRWRDSDEAARRAVIEDLLAGGRVDQQAATRRLHYDLQRTHLAAVLWCDATNTPLPPAERLHRAASAMAHALQAGGTLLLAAQDANAWAWFALPGEDVSSRIQQLRTTVDRPEGVRAALGTPAPGPLGMRRSHREALQAQRVALHGIDDWLCDYRDIRLLALTTAEPEHAHWFVHNVLGPLASEGTRMRELRETLRIYLAEERSLRKAAELLHVARNTVTYRVHRARELLPPTTTAGNSLELRLALEIAQSRCAREEPKP